MNEPTQEELRDYRMPEIKVGQNVLFFSQAQVNSRQPTMGLVVQNNVKSVDIVEVSGNLTQRFGVKHVTDPRLRMNDSQREDGAWDYTPADKAKQEWQSDYDAHLRAIEGCLLGPTKSDRDLLYYYSDKFGIPGYSTRKSDELRTAVLRCLNGQSHGLDEETAE